MHGIVIGVSSVKLGSLSSWTTILFFFLFSIFFRFCCAGLTFVSASELEAGDVPSNVSDDNVE
jgi:hypothetical protein